MTHAYIGIFSNFALPFFNGCSPSRQHNFVRPTSPLGPRPLRLASHARSSLAPEAARLPANPILCATRPPWASAVTPCKPRPKQPGAGSRSPSRQPNFVRPTSPLGLGRYALQATPEAVWRRKPLDFPPTQSCAANVHTWASAVTPCKPRPKQPGAGSRSPSRQRLITLHSARPLRRR